ncbi:MAG TPA: hypothetical protein PKA06_06815 [Gemmatales bacterium]|nr:hypothetical protein [Gemmatales bacterium]HMP16700.1 hypothetical protein [Gemmatales bacterium]
MLNTEQIMGQLLAVLQEGYKGPATPWSYFADVRENGGFLGSISKLSASDASREIAGSSIVAHAHHVAFGMHSAADWIRGNHSPKEWKSSWSLLCVDDTGWLDLQKKLQEAYDDLRQAIAFHSSDSVFSFGGSVGAIAHLAYHLGAIRQKIRLLGEVIIS